MRGFDLGNLGRAGDKVTEGGFKADVVIFVTGPTGAGKSNFIRNVLDSLPFYSGSRPDVSNDLHLGTHDLEPYAIVLPEDFTGAPAKHLALVDTPGFGNPCVKDSEILRRIHMWLASTPKKEETLIGVIYLLPIFPIKVTLSERDSLELLPGWLACAGFSGSKIFPVTSWWDVCPPTVGDRRESEICRFEGQWSMSRPKGNAPQRFSNDTASARRIITYTTVGLLATLPRTLEARDRSIILIMGEAGVGKSSFLSDLVGEGGTRVNAGVEGTITIDSFDIPLDHEGGSVTTFVDCPGYSNDRLTDRQITYRIRKLLENSPTLFAPESKVVGVICLVDLSRRFLPAEWHCILANNNLGCPKLLAVTHYRDETRLESRVSTLKLVPIIKDMVSNGTLIQSYYPHKGRGYAESLLRYFLESSRSQTLSAKHITLRVFLNNVLPK